MSNIILIQHCQSEHHVNNMSGGWTDTSLTDLGRKQATWIGDKFKTVVADDPESEYVIYSSDLLRAAQTAEIIGKQIHLEVIQDKELREINTGIAAGKTKDWAKAHRQPRKNSGIDLDYRTFQNGETKREFYGRVCHCMNNIYDREKKKNIFIVTHGGTLGYITSWWMNFTPEMIINAYFSSSVGGITILSRNDYHQRVIYKFNDTSHFLD